MPAPSPLPIPDYRDQLGSAGIFLVLRRMRIPLIVLIAIFAVSVLGLSLMPGEDAQGRPTRMGLFESFYFMAYTATTIGFGEIPVAFTTAQRLWVTFTIFMAVVGWAYAIGALLALGQDQAFRRALAQRSFARAVRRIREPFLLIVGYGNATKLLARSLDDMGRRFVVLDRDEWRVSTVELHDYRADAPGLVGDARDTGHLVLAGLGHRHCEGVVALSGDDETNLDVAITTAVLRPDLPVIARSSSREMAGRMQEFRVQEVVNPLDRFGDHLRIMLRAPAAYQLMVWLTSAPGTPLPARFAPPPPGPWLIFGQNRFAWELRHDLEAEGIEVTVVHVRGGATGPRTRSRRAHEALHPEAFPTAVAVVAATDNDTTNLWLVEAARRAHPGAFIVSLQNRRANTALFEAVGVDFGMVPAEVVAHEVLARIANPVLMRFLPQVPREGDTWAEAMVERLVEACGPGAPDLWLVRLDLDGAPGLIAEADDEVALRDLLRDPADRDQRLHAVPLAMMSDGAWTMAPGDHTVLRAGDEILMAGRLRDRSAMDTTLADAATTAYVLRAEHVASSWIWKRLTRQERQEERSG
jgi:Trk K+ transport system NAD-binding subunit